MDTIIDAYSHLVDTIQTDLNSGIKLSQARIGSIIELLEHIVNVLVPALLVYVEDTEACKDLSLKAMRVKQKVEQLA